MVSGLISLLITLIIVGVIVWLVLMLIDALPIDARFKQIARVLIYIIAVLVIIFTALPLLGVHTPALR